MRLARLVLFGFKSFAEKVDIAFEPGITAIVGPNGCGKSNLSDAIRWALGEQSARLLRGDRMDDLIFAGSSQRKPLGMAEVSLIFTDNAGDIPTEFRDVTVTRRLYRSGESEYLLNHVPCRLRDITDLFLDTGLGGEPYALIEQGTIGAIVGAKPHERRLLIEEAAGVMTYKVRKKAALAKLESAEQNLLRVGDILHEIERQRNSLKRQAGKAERYRGYQDRARDLKGFLKFHEGQELRQQLDEADDSERTVRQEAEGAQAALAASEAEQETARLCEVAQEEARATSQGRLHEIRSRLSRDEAELSHLRQRLEESARQQEDRQHRAARLQERQATLTQEEMETREQDRQLSEAMGAQAEQLDRTSSSLQALEEAIAEEFSGLEVKRRRLVQDAALLAERRSHLSSLRERERLYGRQRDLAAERRDALQQQDRDLASLEEDQLRFLEGVLRELAHHTGEREELTQRSHSEELTRESIRPELDTLREEAQRLKSRLASLIELHKGFEGYADGHRHLLQQKAKGEPCLAGLRAPLVELIEAPAHYERAIEALLGEALQGLVIERTDDAREAIRLLHEQGHGRATFILPAENGSGCDAATSGLRKSLAALGSSGVIGMALEGLAFDLIRCAEGDRAFVEALLSDAIIVSEMPDALSLARHLPPPYTIATLNGEVVTSRGIITGGPGGGAGLLARRREIAELEQRAGQQREHLRAIEAAWEASVRRSSQFSESLELVTQRLHEVEGDRLKAEKELSLTRGERRRLVEQIDVLTYESKSHAEDLRVLGEEIKGIESGLQEGEERYRLAQTETAMFEARAASRHRERSDLMSEVGELRVRLTSLQGQRELLVRSLARIEEETGRLDAELVGLEHELAEEDTRRTAMQATVVQLQERLAALVEQERLAQQAVAEQEEARQALVEKRELLEEHVRGLRQSLAQTQETLNGVMIRRAELRNTLSHFEATLAEEGLTALEAIAARLSEGGLIVEEAGSELADLHDKISELGGINLAALEEYQELAERHRFLSTQAEDLQVAVRSLRATIAEINKTIQKRFGETLETVNGHLDRLWKRLFSGGQAQLRLIDAEPDDEEQGLDMVVHIPGKRATLNLLSGGEKALASLALLLALFNTRPSPFCLLDEVDAPLDDANVDRFASLLKAMATEAQFIVITHNKRTMEAADILYGVTMGDHGLSTLLSLRMSRAA